MSVSLSLASNGNSNWFESEKPAPRQMAVKQFLQIAGLARIGDRQAQDPISTKELVQIIERDRIILEPHWKESEDAFKNALKAMLKEIGIIWQKRKLENFSSSSSSSSSSSAASEPASKRRKIATDLTESSAKKVSGDALLREIHQVVRAPLEVCDIVRTFCSSRQEEAVSRYFLENCYSFNEWDERAISFQAFVKEQHIDVNTIHSIDLSGLDCASSTILWGIQSSRVDTHFAADLSLTFLFSVLPNLREVKASNAPGFGSSMVSIQLTEEERKRSQLETLDVSHNYDANSYSSRGFGEAQICNLFHNLYKFPRLKTVVLTGCSVSEELKSDWCRKKPEIKLID